MKGDIHETEFMARKLDWQYGIYLHARQVVEGISQAVAKPVEFETVEQDYCGTLQPMFQLSIHQGQQLMDELWNCGLRPSEGTGSAGQLAATQQHLRDMRTIAFNTLNIKEKK